MLKAVLQNPMIFFWWLATPLFWWVKMRLFPADPVRQLNLSNEHPVLYVLPRRSLTDLLVLHHYCRRLGLPLPRNRVATLKRGGTASYLYLQKLGFFQAYRSKDAPPPLLDLVKRVKQNKELEVQLVPVSILWGRDPLRKERSLMKLLFADDEHAGYLQKVFIVLAQGRNSDIQFGQPISIREQALESSDSQQVARKIRRVLRVHFHRIRTATLGPVLYNRLSVTSFIMRSRAVQHAIQHEVKANNAAQQKVEHKAKRMIAEITAEPNHSMIRFFDVLLRYLWNKVFAGIDVKNVDRIRSISNTHELVYLTSHRSHIDYLLLGYVLYHAGLVSPHTAAGANLNFWPAGFFIRRINGFFLRRSFKGNRLYTAIFNEYIHFLISEGHPMNFFPEGGRSRNGRLLPPKTGMIAMVVHSYLRKPTRPVAVVPVYVGYDSVMEVKSYIKELQGNKKKSESFGQLLRARRMFRRKYGRAYLSFGEPIDLGEFVDQSQESWQKDGIDPLQKPQWLAPVVDGLAESVMTKINQAAVVSPVALVSLALLSTAQRAMAEDDLIVYIDTLLQLLRKDEEQLHAPVVGPMTPTQYLQVAEQYSAIQRFKYPGGDVIHLSEYDGALMRYYKNNILHLFALQSLIASYFVYNDSMSQDELVDNCCTIYPFLKLEFYLPHKASHIAKIILSHIEDMVQAGVLQREGSLLSRPEMASTDFTSLRCLGHCLGSVFERYGVSVAILDRYRRDSAFNRDEFESQCQLMAQRISLLTGATSPEYHDRALFKHFVEMLKRLGYISLCESGNGWVISEEISRLAERTVALLSPDIRQSMRRGQLQQAAKDPT